MSKYLRSNNRFLADQPIDTARDLIERLAAMPTPLDDGGSEEEIANRILDQGDEALFTETLCFYRMVGEAKRIKAILDAEDAKQEEIKEAIAAEPPKYTDVETHLGIAFDVVGHGIFKEERKYFLVEVARVSGRWSPIARYRGFESPDPYSWGATFKAIEDQGIKVIDEVFRFQVSERDLPSQQFRAEPTLKLSSKNRKVSRTL